MARRVIYGDLFNCSILVLMKFKIATPLLNCTVAAADGGGGCVYPSPDTASEDSRFFAVCDVCGCHGADEVATRAVYHAVCDTVSAGFDADKPFDCKVFDEALHSAGDVLDSLGVAGGQCGGGVSLAVALLHRGGCFFASIGGAQAMLVRPGSGIVYRSPGSCGSSVLGDGGKVHLQDASLKNLTDLQAGDYIYLSKGRAGIMADEEIVSLLGDAAIGDGEKLQRLVYASVGSVCRCECLVRITDVQCDDDDAVADAGKMQAVAGSSVEMPRRGAWQMCMVVILIVLLLLIVFAFVSSVIGR